MQRGTAAYGRAALGEFISVQEHRMGFAGVTMEHCMAFPTNSLLSSRNEGR